jgi:hypothetical protein
MFERLASFFSCLAVASFLSSGLHAMHWRALSLEGAAAGNTPAAAVVPVSYVVDGARVSGVKLSLPAPQQVKVRLAVNGAWYRCTTVGRTAECRTPGLTVAALDSFQVAAA